MSKLAEIFAHKRTEVEVAKVAVPLSRLKAQIADLPACKGFREALVDDVHAIALIAEVKKASPSQGLIRADFDPVAIAQAYERTGAACLSVLTDARYFQGSPDYLKQIRDAVDVPLLRKDFTVDPYQLYEARAWGADCVLLIVAGLCPPARPGPRFWEARDRLQALHDEARELGLDVLVEVHNDEETDIALNLGANLIGVNNRNLATFKTDLTVSDQLIPRISNYATAVAESALGSLADVDRVKEAGARAVLIGTSFCSSPDIPAKVRQVMGW